MEENISMQAEDFAELRKSLAPDPSHPDEVNVSLEYEGQHGSMITFYRGRVTEAAKQRLPEFTALKILEEKAKWKIVLYCGEEKTEVPFSRQEVDALCNSFGIELIEHKVPEEPAEESTPEPAEGE